MCDEGAGNGGNGDGFTGSTHYVSRSECAALHTSLVSDVRDIKKALWGSEGTTGMVSDVRDIKTERKIGDRFLTLIVGILSSVVTAFIIKVFI